MPASDLRDQLQATLSGSYTLERELGGAGMSRVFVAEETALDRKVVIKVLPPETAAHVSVARFKREILLAAKLQHPHIVPLLTAGESNGLPYDFCSRTHSLLPFGPTPASRPSLSG